MIVSSDVRRYYILIAGYYYYFYCNLRAIMGEMRKWETETKMRSGGSSRRNTPSYHPGWLPVHVTRFSVIL